MVALVKYLKDPSLQAESCHAAGVGEQGNVCFNVIHHLAGGIADWKELEDPLIHMPVSQRYEACSTPLCW
jgi:hypothetical protein